MMSRRILHDVHARRLSALILIACGLLMAPAAQANAATFTVNRTSDQSDSNLTDSSCDVDLATPLAQCTLRAAIQESNDTDGADNIHFNLKGTGVGTIRPTTELPTIAEGVTIDGYTQPGAQVNTLNKGTNAVLMVEISGESAGGANGLAANGGDTTIRGLVINRFQSPGGIGIALGNVPGNTNNLIQGNFIGTDATGTQDLANEGAGVGSFGQSTGNLIGGTAPADRNLIAGNALNGVFLSSNSNTLRRNLVGTDKAGTGKIENGLSGVAILGSSDNLIAANTIAFNGSDGVTVFAGTGNEITTNSIFSNAGLGIDLGDDGNTANDPLDGDAGPNNRQNKPSITSAVTSGGVTTINGKLHSTPTFPFVVRFFSNPSGNEGKRFIGQQNVGTNSNGNAAFTFSPANPVAVGQTITATATGPFGDTSEFSAPRVVASS